MKEIVTKFIEKLKTKEDILGVLIFGSYARGDQRDNSDVDVLVITKNSTLRDVETMDGQAFEMVYASLDDAKSFYEKNPDNAVRQWDDGKIVFDKNGEMEELRAYVAAIKKNGKKDLTEKQRAHLKFDAEDRIAALEYIKEKDLPSANFNLHILAQSLLDLYFTLEKKWTPAPKQSLRVLRVSNPEIAKEFDEFYRSNTFEDRMTIIKRITSKLFK